MTTPQPSQRAAVSGGHIPELDGVRAIAIWLVLAAHLLATPPVDPRGIAGLPSLLRVTIEHGWLGVDLFFVLSGFLITGILLRTKDLGRGEYFRRFYARRAARILPIYFIVLIVVGVAVGAAYLPYLLLCAFMSANFSSLTNVAVPGSAGPYWSLAVEEQFYLVWPWLVLWLGPRRLVVAALAIMVAEPLVRLTFSGALELTWFRADGLAMGSLLAAWFARWNGERRPALVLVGCLLGALAIVTLAGLPLGIMRPGSLSDGFRITQAILAFGALLGCSVAFSGAAWLAPLRVPIAVTTAALSYCIYLVHRPLLDAYDTLAPHVPALGRLALPQGNALRALVVLLAAYGIAALSRRFIELPFMRLTRRRGPA